MAAVFSTEAEGEAESDNGAPSESGEEERSEEVPAPQTRSGKLSRHPTTLDGCYTMIVTNVHNNPVGK